MGKHQQSMYYSGAAFVDNEINNTYPLTVAVDFYGEKKPKTNFVTLTEWCAKNFISKKVGRTLIKKKLLIAQRLGGQWNVCANCEENCHRLLLEYLGVEQLMFDADNQCPEF